MRFLVVVLALASGCTRSNSVTCDDGRICPEDTVCISLSVQAVSPQQCAPSGSVDACGGLADFAPCTNAGVTGVCYPTTDGHACLHDGCGNGILDANEGEVCDDGNAVAGDGCSDSCKSNETCGNGIVDPVTGEQCDDGNNQSHDGCAYNCSQGETPMWTQRLFEAPSARDGVVLAYVASTEQIVMFGGFDGTSVYYNDTWRYDVGGWTQLPIGVAPSIRSSAGMAYDSARKRLVLFGGFVNGGGLIPDYIFPSDTWEFDGTRWSLIAQPSPSGPDGRTGQAMAYDPVRKRVVMFGGGTFGELLSRQDDDTWEWDGTTWTQINITGPTAREGATMAYDPTAGAMILFGGGTQGTASAETWSYDGTWTHLTPATSPGARKEANLVYDPSSHHLVMYGGEDMNNALTPETWSWNGATWAKLSVTVPTSEIGFGLATDPVRGRAVLFGGFGTGNDLAATWEWNGVAWTQATATGTPQLRDQAAAYDVLRGRAVLFGGTPTGSPSYDGQATWELDNAQWIQPTIASALPGVRHAHAMAYDIDREVTVLYGGCTGKGCTTSVLGDTWIWNGSTWQPQTSGMQAPARDGHAMAYDAAHKTIVMFGGADAGDDLLAETWLWNGTWTEVQPAVSPPERKNASMAYDPIQQRVVLFGGLGDDGLLNDTWAWDGTTWSPVNSPVMPPQQDFTALAWSPDRKRLLLFGGADSPNTSTNETWELDATGWTLLYLDGPPPPRAGGSMFPSRDGAGVLIFGGTQGETSYPGLDDVWELSWTSSVADDTCLDQSDSDGDGKAGCADNDCWATCAPTCMPGTSCDPTAPQCGDGVCNPGLETCHSCPSDCQCIAVCGDFFCDPGETVASCPGDCS